MSLFRGKLFAGALFAGALWGPTETPVEPPVPVAGYGAGGIENRVTEFYDVVDRKAIKKKRQEEEAVIMAIVQFVLEQS